MAKNEKLARRELLKRLPPVKYEKGEDKKSSFLDKMSMEKALLALLDIDHEHEYELCKLVAQHVLERVPEPDDVDLEEE
jgi:hypothetical protein